VANEVGIDLFEERPGSEWKVLWGIGMAGCKEIKDWFFGHKGGFI
jgi:hypothetical protein